MSIIISIILFKGGYKITKSSFVILMEATTLDTEEIYNKIKEIEGITDIHEFHIWHTDTNCFINSCFFGSLFLLVIFLPSLVNFSLT